MAMVMVVSVRGTVGTPAVTAIVAVSVVPPSSHEAVMAVLGDGVPPAVVAVPAPIADSVAANTLGIGRRSAEPD